MNIELILDDKIIEGTIKMADESLFDKVVGIKSKGLRKIFPEKRMIEPVVNPVRETPFDESAFHRASGIVGLVARRYSEFSETDREKCLREFHDNRDLFRRALYLDEHFADALSTINALAEASTIPDVPAIAVSFIADNIARIESGIGKNDQSYRKGEVKMLDDVNESQQSLRAASNLVEHGNPAQQALGIDVLERNRDTIIKGLRDQWHKIKPRYLESMIGSQNPILSGFADTILADATNYQSSNEFDRYQATARMVCPLLDSENQQVLRKAVSLLSPMVEAYGLDYNDMIDAWVNSTKKFDLARTIQSNVEAILSLEAQKPGITQFLHQNFGIRGFGRYPLEVLIKQYEEVENTMTPYGVILYPRYDHNGAFYNTKTVFAVLLKQLNGEYLVRVVEAEGKYDIARALIGLNRKYGNQHKIAFAIVGGHGTESSIQFGGNDEKHRLDTQDLMGKGTQRVGEFFEENPTIVLVSCSTGAPEGIGQRLSNLMGARVIAPAILSQIESIKVNRQGGKLDFVVDYKEKDTARTYVGEKT